VVVFCGNASALWMAAGMLWILDASINVSMEPFRAFVADILPEVNAPRVSRCRALFIGLGAVIASVMPYVLTNYFHVQQAAGDLRAALCP
jgi:maltose/moltooligosaccharide transporter